ncbi:fam-a protein [Plasmodium vinckei vinckei]|uniref:Fam-a protein n=1 Tax=Plasmodium vinckei vinckei TaxID=54757 RepID=A0A449BXZ2_PLAVN|nr:fam-a protein [Plasmodium vinckei vinckei]VEV58357.1 fam-a protein [Plasmodium vinckei vinckei]
MNKGYIKITLALLSVVGCIQNIAFASETAATTNSLNKEYKQQLYIDPKEAKQAANVMAEALSVAKKLAIHTNDYKLYSKKYEGASLYFKRVNNTDIAKLEVTIPDPNYYDSIISMLMDPRAPKNFYNAHVEGAISRIYDPNLVIIKQYYRNNSGPCQRYCHLLAKKTELSKDETAIVFVSPDVNDHDSKNNKNYVNPIIRRVNSFKPDINSRGSIRNRNALKMYVNLAAFFIKKEADCVKVTFVGSIDLNLSPKAKEHAVKKVTSSIILDIAKIRDIFKNE